ncbi:hypothetical protein [Candidatus Thalassolituus haligoni]|uniref:hypothetical protein n=1 Tax=Candidatus Thalassolituus haligoni TaxID=3100113 RepID=UPI003512B603|tara:strand:+ start:9046 stop:10005 length:960 start_codon:yes stop_codon:yes gene_type:complete
MKRVFGIAAVLVALAALVVLLRCIGLAQPLSDRWQWHDGELSAGQLASVIGELQQQSLPAEVFDSEDLSGWLAGRLAEVDINGQADDSAIAETRLIQYAELLAAVHGVGNWRDIPGWYQHTYLAADAMANDYLNLCRLWFKRGAALQWQLTALEEQLLAALVSASTTAPAACQSEQDLLAMYRGVQQQQNGIGWLAPAALRQLWIRQLHGRYSGEAPLQQRLSTVSDLIRMLAAGRSDEQIASARALALLTPAEALPALRFQLLIQSAEPLQLAIVSALSGYGSALRPYLPQLKLLQRQTPSDALKSGIQHLIQKTNGH